MGNHPPFTNPPIEPQFYQPSQFFISAITLGVTTTVTTTVNHNYVIGQLVRLIIPPAFGSRALTDKTGYVISIPAADQVTLDINSTGVNPFVSNASVNTQPQIMAVGDINTGIISSTGAIMSSTNIPGTFINISPL